MNGDVFSAVPIQQVRLSRQDVAIMLERTADLAERTLREVESGKQLLSGAGERELMALFERIGELITGAAYEVEYAKRELMALERRRAKLLGPRWEEFGPRSSAATLLSNPNGVVFKLRVVPPSVNDMLRLWSKPNLETWRMIHDWWFDEIRMALCCAEPAELWGILPLKKPAAIFVKYNMAERLKDVNNCLVEKAIIDALVFADVIQSDNALKLPVLGYIQQAAPGEKKSSIDLAVMERDETIEEIVAVSEGYFRRAQAHTAPGYTPEEGDEGGKSHALEEDGYTGMHNWKRCTGSARHAGTKARARPRAQ